MALFIPELIKRKRDGGSLTEAEIRAVVGQYTAGNLPDYQMAALLMAIFFRGLSASELDTLTDAMIRSGRTLDLSDVPGVKVDKHSTGGVGDKISLALAPAVAALGVPVPMMSGRGLGHTGGTLDKLESIPGFDVHQSMERARAIVKDHGLFLIGQTDDLAPADRKMYALRDVTGTVESIPLIASSIMSKKLAEGIDALVLDVKVGSGAFMKGLEEARELAKTLVAIGVGAGKQVRALLTRMDAPIGVAVGNALEVIEAIDVMQGRGPEDTTRLTVALGAEMLVLGKKAENIDVGEAAMRQVLSDGRALEKFADIVEAHGGDRRVVDDPDRLPRASQTVLIPALEAGCVTGIDPYKVAMAALAVGAGRRTKEEQIDPAAGVVLLVKPGDIVELGEPVAELHHNGNGDDAAEGSLTGAFQISRTPKTRADLIIERLS
jgi:pyrimidine-nucleoside phosphorylase